MRGYRFLKESNKLNLITEVKESLTNTHFNNVSTNASSFIFGAGLNNAELIIRQYLLVRVANLNLNKSLLYALGKPVSKVIHPLPPEWRKIIEQHGFNVAKIQSAVAWNCFVLLMLIYGFYSIAIQILKNLKAIMRFQVIPLGMYAYFDKLTVDNLPKNTSGRQCDIITWYQQWPGRVKNLDSLCHNVNQVVSCKVTDTPIISIPSAIVPLTQISPIIRFIGWGIAASIIATIDLLRGNWWPALVLSEAASSRQVNLQDSKKLAQDYMFHNSNWIYRPLWTYEAEKRGSRICFYFYSTNCESFKLPEGYPIQANSWQVINWPYYLVWDKYQFDFVRRNAGTLAKISIVGPIDFIASPLEMVKVPLNSFAIFDVQPVRESFYCTLGIAFEFYIPEICNQFLIDILKVLKSKEITMVHKRKRSIGNLAHYQYRNFLRDLKDDKAYINIDSDICAKHIIADCLGVISMPFTSTALLGMEFKKPSIFYDPSGQIQKDDIGAHGIPIVTGIEELREWVSNVLSQSQY